VTESGFLDLSFPDRLVRIKQSLAEADHESCISRGDVLWMVGEIEDLRERLLEALDK
jgi:hypothetical protein